MVDIWLGFAFLLFVLFLYVKVRKSALMFFDNEIIKVRKEFSELESLKQELEILRQEAIKNIGDLPHKKSSLLKESRIAAQNAILKKKTDLEFLKDSKIASMQNSLELSYKRKSADVQKDILKSTCQILTETLSKEKTEQDSVLEVCQALEKLQR